jgi:hypothetical protein
VGEKSLKEEEVILAYSVRGFSTSMLDPIGLDRTSWQQEFVVVQSNTSHGIHEAEQKKEEWTGDKIHPS